MLYVLSDGMYFSILNDDGEYESSSSKCNTFDLLFGFLWYNETQTKSLVQLVTDENWKSINAASYDILYAAHSIGQTDEVFDASWRQDHYE